MFILKVYFLLVLDLNQFEFMLDSQKEPRRKVHEEVIAEDYDNAKEDLNQIDITQRFMVHLFTSDDYFQFSMTFNSLYLSISGLHWLS